MKKSGFQLTNYKALHEKWSPMKYNGGLIEKGSPMKNHGALYEKGSPIKNRGFFMLCKGVSNEKLSLIKH